MRIGYDNSKYQKAKAKLPSPDGKHCVICKKKLPKWKRKYCSNECWNDWFNSNSHIFDWNALKEKALGRDKRTCQECGHNENFGDNPLQVHHIKPISEGGKEFDINNCITLCHKCHWKKHNHVAKLLREGQKTLNMPIGS